MIARLVSGEGSLAAADLPAVAGARRGRNSSLPPKPLIAAITS